jgi:hypothetical protein
MMSKREKSEAENRREPELERHPNFFLKGKLPRILTIDISTT